MKVSELTAMFEGAVEIDCFCAWNSRGNTPSKGFNFKAADKVNDAYGEQEVMSWELVGRLGYVELSFKMCGTDV